jgi:hypothetical protein
MKTRKIAAVIILAALVAGSASALDFTTFPSPIEKGCLLISPNIGLGSFYSGWASETLFGGDVAVDYALPINFALTVGGELGFYGSKLGGFAGYDATVGLIPILGRVAWHPNWEVKGLDTYVMFKLGIGMGFWGGSDKPDGITNPFGFSYSFNIGGRYFFTDMIGAFLEVGYEYYFLDYEYDLGKLGTYTAHAFGDKFLTLGATFRL